MSRRNFIKLSLLGVTGAIIAPTDVLASMTSSMAGGVYYTREAPGRWHKKVAAHLPIIEVSGRSVQTITPHEMKGYEHYIVKHVLLDHEFKFIAENMFDPMKDQAAVSAFNLGGYRGRIHVLSLCNKHDNWLSVAEV